MLQTIQALSANAAEDPPGPWSLRLGLADVSVSMDVSVKMAGTAVPGARGTNNEDILLLGEFGYALTPTWTALAAGYHAHHDHQGGGALTALAPPLTGTIGKLTYAPLMMTATFQFEHWQGVRPYFGGGYQRVPTRRASGDL